MIHLIDITFAELAYNMKITEKCDVYSFRVLVLRVLVLWVIKGEHPVDILTSLASTSTNQVELKDLVDHLLPVPLLEIKKVLTSILVLAMHYNKREDGRGHFSAGTKCPRRKSQNDKPNAELTHHFADRLLNFQRSLFPRTCPRRNYFWYLAKFDQKSAS